MSLKLILDFSDPQVTAGVTVLVCVCMIEVFQYSTVYFNSSYYSNKLEEKKIRVLDPQRLVVTSGVWKCNFQQLRL